MRCLLTTIIAAYSCAVFAQTAATNIVSAYQGGPKPSDAVWNQWAVAEKCNYSLQVAEEYMEPGAKLVVASKRKTSKYIYFNTLQLHNLGGYRYSDRQRFFFEKEADSIAYYFRRNLLLEEGDLYFWHNILLTMEPDWRMSQVLLDYYAYSPKQQSETLTLLMQMMARDSFPEFIESRYYKKMGRQKGVESRIVALKEDKEMLYDLASNFQWDLYRTDWKRVFAWDRQDDKLLEALEKTDSLYKKTRRMSEVGFNQLNARELLAYCRYKPELYAQICAAIPDYKDYNMFMYSSFSQGAIDEYNFSERQKKRIAEKRDSCAALLTAHIKDDPYDEKRYDHVMLLLCNTWEAIPYLVEADKLYGFHSRYYILVLRNLMIKADYKPYWTFLKTTNESEGHPETTDIILNTKENHQKIWKLAEDFYQSKHRK